MDDATGNITNSYSTGRVFADGNYAGGLVGYTTGNITDSYSTGRVSAYVNYAGGLVGRATGSITNSYSTGVVFGRNDAGGLVGYATGSITNSYSTGRVSAAGDTIGGLVGLNTATISNSYWFKWSGNSATQCYSDGDTNCFKIDSNVNYFYTVSHPPINSWNFTSIWDDLYDGIDYPLLLWQVATAPPVLSEFTPVSSPTKDTTPDYTFSSSEAGAITYGGSCSSTTTAATVGNNTITFNALSEKIYGDCTITVTDGAGNVSKPLLVSEFTIDVTSPTITINYPTGGLTINQPTWQANFSYDYGDATICEYSFDNGANWTNFSSCGDTSITPSQGANTLIIKGTDAAGNSAQSAAVALTISATTKNWDFNTASDYTYNNAKVEISPGQAQNSHYFKLLVDSTAHTDYGLSYPVTYEFSIPSGSSGLKVYKRYTAAHVWTQIAEKTSSDFFNGIEAVRFDYTNNKAYISVAFSATSDEIDIKIVNASDQIVSATYSKISTYYDNRVAAVTSTTDEWENKYEDEWDSATQAACGAFTSRSIWLTPAIVTNYQGSPPYWGNIQNKINAGYIEPGSHSRTHYYVPYLDYDSEVSGSKDDIIDNLTLPALNTKGSQEYLYAWIEPGGGSNSTVRSKIGQYKYLADRSIIPNADNSFATWDSGNIVFNRIGSSYFWDIGSLSPANSAFDSVVSAGGIYYLWGHSLNISWSPGSWILDHLDYIEGKKTIWYVGFGHLYLYRYIAAQSIVAVSSISGDDDPTIQPTTANYFAFNNFLSSFVETATKNGGEIKYQISNDAGTTWYWYNSGWTTTTSGYSEANTATGVNSINTNISTFPVGSGQFLFKAYLHSDGTQLVQLNLLTVGGVPLAPTIGTPTALSTTSINWNFTCTADNETGFKLYDDLNNLISTNATANLTYIDETGLSANTQYTRYIKAYNSYGNSSASSTASKYTLANTPNAPTVGSATGTTLGINPVTGGAESAMAIYVEQGATCDGSGGLGYVQASGSISGSAAWQTDAQWATTTATGLTAVTQYSFCVKARNGDATETGFGSAASGTTTTSNIAPNAPTLVSPANASSTSNNKLTLSANYSDPDTGDTGTTNYRISSSSLVNCVNNTNIVASGTSSETLTNNENTTWTPSSSIGSDATYYWCVQNNDGSTTSSWTQMGSFLLDTTAPTLVGAPTFGTVTTNSIFLNKPTTVTEETSGLYQWQVRRNSSTELGFTAVSTTLITDTSLLVNTQYTYDVQFKDNASNNSNYGTSASKYTLAPTPTNLVGRINREYTTLTVDTLNNQISGSSGYYFYRTDNPTLYNSDWIQTNTWQDTNITCGTSYTYYVKYRNGDGTETSAVSLTQPSVPCGANATALTTQPPQQNQTTEPQTTDTIAQLTQRINEIKAQIQNLLSQLQTLNQTTISSPNTFHFTKNLRLGTIDEEVRQLQKFLNSHDFKISNQGPGSPNKETNIFGPLTRDAVIRFQEYYLQDILSPLNFTQGTGVVAEYTRKKLNEILGK